MPDFLTKNKTVKASLVLSLLGAVYFLDCLVHSGGPAWFPQPQYEAVAAFVGGLTGVAMRLGIAKGEVPQP